MPVDTVAANKIIVQCHNLNLNLVTGSDLKIKYPSKNIYHAVKSVDSHKREKKKKKRFLKKLPFCSDIVFIFREGEFHPVFVCFF